MGVEAAEFLWYKLAATMAKEEEMLWVVICSPWLAFSFSSLARRSCVGGWDARVGKWHGGSRLRAENQMGKEKSLKR